ncbi:ABC transporter permease [bacterium]|nr:ABC transporter permease [bacterium]
MKISWRKHLNTLGPLVGLIFVVVIFATLLAWKDVMDGREFSGETGVSFFASIKDTDFYGLKAFLGGANAKIVLTQTVIVALGALGMTVVIISGGIDLSAGSVVALCSVVGAQLLNTSWASPWGVVLITVAAGGVVGLVNGGVVAGLRMMPFIVTLGMMTIARGAAKWLGGNQTVNFPDTPLLNLMALHKPDAFFPLPYGVWITAGLAVLTALLLRQTIFGRYVFAIGSNEATARLCGIRVQWMKVVVYALAGLYFGLAGLMQMARLAQGDPTVAIGLELDMIAAVVIGGASLNGGAGSVAGSMVGALIMTTLRSGSQLMGWPNYFQEIIIGTVIVLAVALDRLRHRAAK